VLSLRDVVFRRLCERKGLEPGKWSDLVSSDDSYTCHSVPAHTPQATRDVITLMLKAQEVVERLMNVWTSGSKSSITALIGEFNSCFVSNLTTIPATIKFAISSVPAVNTDSFTTMVDECYNSSRQLFENGGTLELYEISQKLNKKYCEDLYHTQDGKINSPTQIFNIPREKIPHQLGVFPLDDPSLMLQFGPSCWNMRILIDSQNDSKVMSVFSKAHSFIQEGVLEDVADLLNPSDLLFSTRPINAITRIGTRLKKMREKCPLTQEDLRKKIEENPLIMMSKPVTIDEIIFRTCMKLFQRSAIDAMKSTEGSLFYGRVAASVSAKAFRLFGTEQEELLTYKECLFELLKLPDPKIDYNIFYDRKKEYITSRESIKTMTDYHPRNPLEVRTLNSYNLSEVMEKLSKPVPEILNHFWLATDKIDSNVFKRDMINLKSMVPIIKDTMEETMESLGGNSSDRISKLCLVLMRLLSIKTNKMKAFTYGRSSQSYEVTPRLITGSNKYNNRESKDGSWEPYIKSRSTLYDEQSYWFNIFLLGICENNVDALRACRSNINEDVINDLCSGQKINFTSKKRFMFMLSYYNLIIDARSWSRTTNTIIHKWNIRQKRTKEKTWTGNFSLDLQRGDLIVRADGSDLKGKLFANTQSNLNDLYEILNDLSNTLNIPINKFRGFFGPGNYDMDKKGLRISESSIGFKIHFLNLPNITLQGREVLVEDSWVKLLDERKKVIMDMPKSMFFIESYPDAQDVKLEQMSTKTIIELRLFSRDFSLRKFSNKFIVERIEDLNIDTDNDGFVEDEEEKFEEIEIKYELGDLSAFDDMDLVWGDMTDEKDEILAHLYELNSIDYLMNMPSIKETDPFRPVSVLFTRYKLIKSNLIAFVMLGRTYNVNSKLMDAVEKLNIHKGITNAIRKIYNLQDKNVNISASLSFDPNFMGKFDL